MSATLDPLTIWADVDYAGHIAVRLTEEREGEPLSEGTFSRVINGTGLALLVSARSVS